MRNLSPVTLAMLSVVIAGCAGKFEDPPQQSSCASPAGYSGRIYKGTLPELTYAAIDKMTLCARPEISPIVPVTVSSITESQRVNRSSTFGNVVADFARTRLAQNWMDVSEPRLRSRMLLKEDQGEMMLDRDPRNLVTAPKSAEVVTGTYGVGDKSVYVSLKLIQSDTGKILSAADFVVWREGDVDKLLGNTSIAINQ